MRTHPQNHKFSFLVRLIILVVISAILLFSLIIPALTASPVKVTMLMQALEAAQWQPFVEEFNQLHPDIELDIVEGPNATNQVEDLYTSSFLLGNSPYDLVYMDIVWVPKFAAAGWLQSLSDRISQTELSDFLEGDINGGRYQGELYRMPVRSDAGMLYYRTDLLKEAGYDPPTTFTELLDISQTLEKDELVKWGYLWQGKQYEGLSAMFVEVLAGYGAFWVNPDTLEVGLDSPEAIAAVKFLQSTLTKKVSPPGITTYAEEEARRLFQNGGAAFMRNWPYAFGLLSESDSPVKGKFAIKPMVHAPSHSSGACLGGWGVGLATSTQHPDEAWKVAEFMSSKKIQRKFVLATGYVPSRHALFNDPTILAKYPYYSRLLEVVESAVLRPPIAQYAQASDILQRYLSAAITNQMTPEQAMRKAANETRRLLDRPL